MIEKYGEVALTGKSTNFEFFYQKEGKYFDIYSFSPEKGKFASIFKDITQSKKAESSLHEAYKELQSQSEKLQAFNEELQIQSEELLAQTEELQETYDALQKSEERYRTLFTNMTEGFLLAEVIYDRNGKPYDYRYLEVNPVYERSTGLKREQILGKSILEILPNVNPILIEKIGETVLSGKLEHFEIFSQVTSKYFDTYVFSPDKEKVAATFRDITGRKQAEEALRESEEKYRTIVETASEGIWVGDAEARTVYINKRMTEILGYTQDEVLGKFAWDFVSEEEKPIIKKYIEKRRQGISESYEFKFIRKDGSPLWTIVSSKPLFDNAGKFTGSMSMLTDITARKEAEAKLRETMENLEEKVKERTAELEKAYNLLKESKESLAEAQKLAHLGNWDLNIETGKIYWSHEMYLIFGRDLREPAPQYDEFLNYVHPEDRGYVSNALKDALSGKFYSTDYRIMRTNGEERIVNMQSEVIFDEKNTPVRMRGIVQDITERKRIEKELQESESRFRNLFEVISSGVIIYDVIDDGRDFIFRDINPAGEQINHVRREDIVGKSLYEFFPHVSEIGLDAIFRRVWLTGKPESFPMTYYKDENIALWVTNYVYRLPSGELVAVFEDVTERKQAEEERERLVSAIQQEKDRLAALINSITDEVWFADTRKNFTLINPPAYSEFYIPPGKEIEVEKFLENVKVYRPDGSLRPINESPALRALQGEVVKNQEEIVCMPAHRKSRYRQVSAAPVRDKGGNIIGSVSVARDITEHKKAEEMLAKIEIARKKEIHHRIKNNLQVISSLLDLQAEKFNNRECIKDSEVFAAFRESQDRVMSIALIHEELHEGGGDNELNFSVYLKKLIENLFQTYRIGNAGISLKIDLEENLFFDVNTAVPLGMIVNELVSNSFKHAFPGRDEKGIIQIKLSSEKSVDERSNKGQLAERGNAYTLIVSDNGVGIPRNIDFENPDTLGLQLVAILVDQLGGEIEMERDKGTEFRIRVNVKQT